MAEEPRMVKGLKFKEGVDSGYPKRSDGIQPLTEKGPLGAAKDARAKNRCQGSVGRAIAKG